MLEETAGGSGLDTISLMKEKLRSKSSIVGNSIRVYNTSWHNLVIAGSTEDTSLR
jgi:hypothetical protein